MEQFSVLMSVYRNSVAAEVKACLESLYTQTVPSDDLVIVTDGPVSDELAALLDAERAMHPELNLVPLTVNVGLGKALREGMKHCRHGLVARMDTDDLCVPDRFERQLACFEKDPSLAVAGGNISEFIGTPDRVTGCRNVPSTHEEICAYLKKRCPFNHMTVMLRKSEVERAGGYLHWHYNEDSYLWVRMYLAGCRFYNLDTTLVYARIDDKTFMRRGGYKYYVSERDMFRYMRNRRVITAPQYLKAKTQRFILQVMLPNLIRKWVFGRFARSKTAEAEK